MVMDDTTFIKHMLDTTVDAIDRIKGCNRQDFDEDHNLQLAVVHLIQIIGEAARLVTQNTREKYPAIPWHKIIGMRHRIVHDYLTIDYDRVWNIATFELPLLLAELEKIIPPK